MGFGIFYIYLRCFVGIFLYLVGCLIDCLVVENFVRGMFVYS